MRLALTSASAASASFSARASVKLATQLRAPLWRFKRSRYIRVNSSLARRDGSKLGFGGVYNLSKRTNLYATLGKSSGDRFTAAQKKAAFGLGVTHRF